jgi:hypothetical protein
MRNFELIAILNKLPAGAKVIFCSTIEKKQIVKDAEGNYFIYVEISDIDGNENEITLLC